MCEPSKLVLDKNLRLLLKKHDLKIVDLSKKTGIPLQTIHGWLSGVEPKKLTNIKILADFFRVDIESLCFLEKFK